MTDLRVAAQQALEALTPFVRGSWTPGLAVQAAAAMDRLKAALAEPVEPVAHKHEWFSTGAMKPGQMRCIHCGVWNHEIPPQRPAEPVQEPQGCDHCNHPLYAATKCRVCGRVTEAVQEPVAWRFEARHIDSAWAAAVTLKHPGPEGVYMRNVTPLYAAPPQRPAEPVQEPVEPVAYIHRQGRHWEVSDRPLADDEKARGWTEEPLYTSPPQRLPLTDEEIFKIENDIPDDVIGDRAWTICFARAIERAHGIGGEE